MTKKKERIRELENLQHYDIDHLFQTMKTAIKMAKWDAQHLNWFHGVENTSKLLETLVKAETITEKIIKERDEERLKE